MDSFSKNKKFKRICVSCNNLYAKHDLLKIDSKSLKIDEEQIIPSRSFYIYPAKECIHNFAKFSRKLQKRIKNVSLNNDFFESLMSKVKQDTCPGSLEEDD
ncbi:MAG: DUF448 domain-containing protein [Candidatus Caenarcaniphilales bacterium]|nr:DUF448 domain-containing protein [Candidatus Caenarcaniphilales bacterium]